MHYLIYKYFRFKAYFQIVFFKLRLIKPHLRFFLISIVKLSRLEESIISIHYLFMVRVKEHMGGWETGDFWKIKHLKGY